MKLGKEALLAIAESALFIVGAIFFVMVITIPSNPIWALIAGILFGLAGVILWLLPFLVKFIRRMQFNTNAADISQKIQGADKPESDTYELHRADSYDSFVDKNFDQPAGQSKPVPEPKPKPAPTPAPQPTDQPVAEPNPEPAPEAKPEPTEPAAPDQEPEPAPTTKSKAKPKQKTKPDAAPTDAK